MSPLVSELLRSPARAAARCRDDAELGRLGLASLACIVVGSVAFGAAVGSFRGGSQIAWAALKMPLALVATLAVCAPAFHAFAAALGRPWPLRTVVALVLASAARAALVLLAAAPVLWLALDSGLGYHASALAAACAWGLAGLAALGVLLRGLGEGAARFATALAFVAVFFAVGGQSAWILRPWLGRPSDANVPVWRSTEGGFPDALYTSAKSAAGIYDATRTESRAAQRRWVGASPDGPSYEPPPRTNTEDVTPRSAPNGVPPACSGDGCTP